MDLLLGEHGVLFRREGLLVGGGQGFYLSCILYLYQGIYTFSGQLSQHYDNPNTQHGIFPYSVQLLVFMSKGSEDVLGELKVICQF